MPYRSLFEPRVGSYIGFDFPGNELADRQLSDRGLLPMGDFEADIALSTQVLEHVRDPETYLAECRRVLKKSGLLILSTHGVWRYHPDPCDYWRWTSQGLKQVLSDAGFEIIRFRGIMGPGATALQLWQDAVLRRLHWRLERPFSALMQCLIMLADRRCPAAARDADASVYMTVSRRI
jgi:SAM-dependent methyltransferase